MDATWIFSKAFFFCLGVYFLFATLFDITFGADGHEYAVLLAGIVALVVASPIGQKMRNQ